MLSDTQLEEFFGVPIINEIVELESDKLYGFASCNNIHNKWQCIVGGFQMIYGRWKGEYGLWELYDDGEENTFYNSVFFEIEKVGKRFKLVGIIMHAKMNNEMEYLCYGKENNNQYGIVIRDLTLVMLNTFENFEWEI